MRKDENKEYPLPQLEVMPGIVPGVRPERGFEDPLGVSVEDEIGRVSDKEKSPVP